MDKKKFSKKLRDFREMKDLPRKEVAAKLNLSYDAYARKERGERSFRQEEISNLIDILGEEISDYLKEENKMSKRKGIKNEVGLLETIICLIGSVIEINLVQKFETICPEEIVPSFEEYLKSEYGYHENPNAVFDEIKTLTQEYGEFIISPHEWYRKKSKELYPYFMNDNFSEEKSKDFGEYHPFHPYFRKEDYEYLKDKDDTWLREFVVKEENYGFCYSIIYDGSVMVIPRTEENAYAAFQRMLEEEPLIKNLFQYGLLENSWFNNHWEKYQKEENSGIILFNTKQGNISIEQIRDKMKDIFLRKSQQDKSLKVENPFL